MKEKKSFAYNNRKFLNLCWAIALLMILILIAFVLVYPSQSKLGRGFDIFVLLIFFKYAAIILGVLCLILRIAKVLRDNSNLLCAVSAISNLFIGISAIAFYFFGVVEKSWLIACLPNLLVGVVILADMLLPAVRNNSNMQSE